MKKIILFIATIIVFTSCDVLDVHPYDSLDADAAFKDKSGIERGILGSYSSFQSLSHYGLDHIVYGDLAADNLIHKGTSTNYGQVDNNSIMTDNTDVEGLWASMYEGINVANNIIDRVPSMTDMTDEEKNLALGELYFIRALNHFNLLNYFGPIPIKTKPTQGVDNLDAGRDPIDKVYSQIITDLSSSEQYLKASASTKIRASKYAATALLARVYLYNGDFDSAYSKANNVILNGGYLLSDDYADIFSGDGSAETIFEIDFTELDRNRIAEYNMPKTINGREEVAPDETLINAYEPGDERKDFTINKDTIISNTDTVVTSFYANKYNDLSKGADNVIVIRLAEMYLIRAEAGAYRTGGNITSIQNDINEIRGRANLTDTPAATISELINAIEKERRVEFAFEGHRWFDLVRTGRAVDVLPNVNNSNQTLFPIPISEIQTNNSSNMYQNNGY